MNAIAQRVSDIMSYCLFKDEEIKNGKIPTDAIIVEGVISKYGFHPDRIAEKKQDIKNICAMMPPEFHKSGGGGMSFLQLCMDNTGDLWGQHVDMERLCVLAIAAGIGHWCMPRELWSILPAGMPYIVFDV